MTNLKYPQALEYLENGEYLKAHEIYQEMGEKYHQGYCQLLLGNEDEAEKLWHSAPDSAPCAWGRKVLDFIRLKNTTKPTYLQIRNHLETDIGYFIKANKINYAENIMKYDHVFISVNLESYKLIGRALLNFGFMNQARKYLVKSLEVIPHDAESYYYIGKYNYKIGAYKECQMALNSTLEENPNHLPARALLEKVGLKLKQN